MQLTVTEYIVGFCNLFELLLGTRALVFVRVEL